MLPNNFLLNINIGFDTPRSALGRRSANIQNNYAQVNLRIVQFIEIRGCNSRDKLLASTKLSQLSIYPSIE